MATHRHWFFTPAAASTTRFASSVSGAGPFTLTNTTAVDYDVNNVLAHQVTMTGLTATNLSAINVTFVGTDADGAAYKETIAAPNGAVTVTTVGYFSTLTSVTPASTFGATTVKIGHTVTAVSESYHINFYQNYPDVGLSVVVPNANITYGIADTLGDPSVSSPTFCNNLQWISNISGKTASQDLSFTYPISAVRLTISGSSGTDKMYYNVIQGMEY